ncbi:MAG: ABC transporter permease [Candidatus Dormibacteraeota bacterium]|nr:ABC transporter permease [Candidatus Dormibacteraeota bacterium]
MTLDTDPGVAPQEEKLEMAADLTAAKEVAATDIPPELVAQSFGGYLRAWMARIRSGDSGVLPVLLGLIGITIVFEIISPNNVFLNTGNLVNLFQQSAVFMVLGMAEIFVLLLGEIDLSVGYVGAVGGAIAIQLVQPVTINLPWWLAIAFALVVCALIGAGMGFLITRLRLPSFVVTLAGYLIFNGVLLIILLLGPFSGYPTLCTSSCSGAQNNSHIIYQLMWGTIDPTVSWIGLAVIVALFGGSMWWRDSKRRRSGLVAPPPSLTFLKIALIAVIGVVLLLICNANRGRGVVQVVGVPWVIPIVLALLVVWMVLLERTRFGRYVYAVGGNPEAARRAGVNVNRVRTLAFALCSATAGIAGLLYAANQGGLSNNVNGGQLVLYAVAAAVIGGTSLFGGRGRALHGVLGGLVIGAIYNGLYLLGLAAQYQFIATGIVLLVAVTVDALSRRGAATGARA